MCAVVLHIHPPGDLLAHDLDSEEGCACLPTIIPVERDDGSMAWLVVHHAWDGRD